MQISSHRLLVIFLSVMWCFMTTGCFSCSLSTSEATPIKAVTSAVDIGVANNFYDQIARR